MKAVTRGSVDLTWVWASRPSSKMTSGSRKLLQWGVWLRREECFYTPVYPNHVAHSMSADHWRQCAELRWRGDLGRFGFRASPWMHCMCLPSLDSYIHISSHCASNLWIFSSVLVACRLVLAVYFGNLRFTSVLNLIYCVATSLICVMRFIEDISNARHSDAGEIFSVFSTTTLRATSFWICHVTRVTGFVAEPRPLVLSRMTRS